MSVQQQQQQPSEPDPFSREAQAKLFEDDLVYHSGGLGNVGPGKREELAIVERCYYDPQESVELPTLPPEQDPENLHRPLKSKEYGITCYPSGKRAIVHESTLEVRDRAFQTGDRCKRSVLPTTSGVILSVTTEVQLEHVLSKQRTDWVPASEFTNAARVFVGDHVINSNWVGVVEEVFEEALVELNNAQDVVRVCDVGSRLIVGEIDPLRLVATWPALSPYVNKGPCHVVDVKQTVVCVNWLGINQKLTPEQQEHCSRPERYWTNLKELIMARNHASHTHAIGNRVIPVDRDDFQKYGIKPSIHGSDNLELITMVVVSTRTKVEVLWQDNTQTTESATALIPYYNLDEYGVWPGNFVVWMGDSDNDSATSKHKVGIIQSMHPEDRSALVRWYDNTLPERVERRNRGEDVTAETEAADKRTETELVPVFELDVHDSDSVAFGVHRGDVVFISARPNGLEIPQLGRIGKHETDSPGQTELKAQMRDLADLRMQMIDSGMQLAKRYARNCPLILPRPGSEATEIDWYGEVVGKRMDGVVEVRIPCGRIVETTTDRLMLLSDGFEDDGGGWVDDAQWNGAADQVERDEWDVMEIDGLDSGSSTAKKELVGDELRVFTTIRNSGENIHWSKLRAQCNLNRPALNEILATLEQDKRIVRSIATKSTTKPVQPDLSTVSKRQSEVDAILASLFASQGSTNQGSSTTPSQPQTSCYETTSASSGPARTLDEQKDDAFLFAQQLPTPANVPQVRILAQYVGEALIRAQPHLFAVDGSSGYVHCAEEFKSGASYAPELHLREHSYGLSTWAILLHHSFSSNFPLYNLVLRAAAGGHLFLKPQDILKVTLGVMEEKEMEEGGVYLLTPDAKHVYIGQTQSFRERERVYLRDQVTNERMRAVIRHFQMREWVRVILLRLDGIPNLVRNVVETAINALLHANGQAGLNVNIVDRTGTTTTQTAQKKTNNRPSAQTNRDRKKSDRNYQANMTPEQHQRHADRQRKSRANRTPEERQLEADQKRIRRENWTPERRQHERDIDNRRKRKAKLTGG
ncbi:hypothetical protein CF327_g6372 [Tilletia walkeri]|nr:hypothetical protein CF327_g6372 [Tilletia walkeri]